MPMSLGHVSARLSPPGDTGQLRAENTGKKLGDGAVGPVSASSLLCALRLQLPGPLPSVGRFAQGAWYSRSSMDYGIRHPHTVIWGPVFNKHVLFSNAFHFSRLQSVKWG